MNDLAQDVAEDVLPIVTCQVVKVLIYLPAAEPTPRLPLVDT